MNRLTNKFIVKLSIYGLLLTTLYGIALAIKDYGIIKELQIGNEVSDSILYWNDVLPLIILILQAIFYCTLVGYLLVKLLRKARNLDTESCNEKSTSRAMICKVDLLLNLVSQNLFKSKATKSLKKYIKLVVFLLILIALLFNPFTRFFASLVLPAENLFHFIQQVRISLIFQIVQLFWVVFLWAIIYVVNLRRKRAAELESI